MLDNSHHKESAQAPSFEDFLTRFQGVDKDISGVCRQLRANVDDMAFCREIADRELLLEQKSLIGQLRALVPKVDMLAERKGAFSDHEDRYHYANMVPEFYHTIEYESELHTRLADIYIFNSARGKPPAFMDDLSLTSDTIRRREEILSQVKSSFPQCMEERYLELLKGLNILEESLLCSYLCENPAIRRQEVIRGFQGILRCAGISFHSLFPELPSDTIPGTLGG